MAQLARRRQAQKARISGGARARSWPIAAISLIVPPGVFALGRSSGSLFHPVLLRSAASAETYPSATCCSTSAAARATAKSGANGKAWVMPRTADGHPDFSGYWNQLTFTPMERPAKFGGREFLTKEEMEQVFKSGVRGSYDPGGAGSEDRYGGELFNPDSADYDATTYGLSPWQNGVKPNPRTSLVVDPPDGRIPPLTPEAKARLAARTTPGEGFPYVVDDHHGGATVHADNARDLGQGTSCVTQSGGPPLTPPEYNAGVFIAQNPDDIVIETETGSEFRVIPLNSASACGSEHSPMAWRFAGPLGRRYVGRGNDEYAPGSHLSQRPTGHAKDYRVLHAHLRGHHRVQVYGERSRDLDSAVVSHYSYVRDHGADV